MINYSISIRNVVVTTDGVKTKVKKGYAVCQSAGTVDSEAFEKQLEAYAGTGYTRSALNAIMSDIEESMKELLAQGYNVDCGELGKFYPALSSQGVLDASDFSPVLHIKKVYAKWGRPEKLTNIVDPTPTYNYVATNEWNDAGKKAQKGAKNQASIVPENN